MYGYAARYAPSMVIEARIDALVVRNLIFWAPYNSLNSVLIYVTSFLHV